MVRDLKELRNSQEEIRDKIMKLYMEKKSIMRLAKEAAIPYSTLHSFLNGNRVSMINIIKLKEYLSSL